MFIFWVLSVLLPLVIAFPQPDYGAQVILAEVEPGTNYTLDQYRSTTWFRNVFAPGRPSQFQFTKFCPEEENEYEHCQHFTDYDLFLPSPGRIHLTEDGFLTLLNVSEEDVGEYFPAIFDKDPSQPMVTVRLVLKTADQHPVNLPEPLKTLRKRSVTVREFDRMVAPKLKKSGDRQSRRQLKRNRKQFKKPTASKN